MPKRVRSRQRAATTALVKQEPTTQFLTLRDINTIVRRPSLTRTGGEFGASGTQSYQGTLLNTDYNRLFDGANGIAIYDQMEKSDGQVGAAVDIIKLPLRAATWRCVPPEDASDDEKAIAELVHFALFGENAMVDDWDFVLRHLLMRVDKGFGLVEKVWFFDEDRGMLRFQRLAPRLPVTVKRWIMFPNGRLKSIEQYVSINGQFAYREIPIEYAIPSVREREGDNYFGRSILRRIHKHWYYKDECYRIDAVRLDRYGVGIPVAEIDPTHPIEEDELNEIETMLASMRSNERGYIMTPSTVKFRIMVPEGGHGGATGLIESVKHHDTMIVRGVLAQFMSDHAEGLNTNRTRTLADIFLHSLRAEAKAVAGDLQTHAVRPLCDMNFDMSTNRYPSIEVVGIEDVAPDALAQHLPNLVTGRLLTPDDNIENMLRKLFGLPPMPTGYLRGEEQQQPPAAPPAPDEDDDDPPGEPDDPEAVEASVIDAAMQGARAIVAAAREHSGHATPPTFPPITIVVNGKKQRAIELYEGQPRGEGGKFGPGKKAQASGAGERQPANHVPLGENVKSRLSQGGSSDELFAHVQANAPDMVAEVNRLVEHGRTVAQPELDSGLRTIANDLGFKYHDNIEDRTILDDQADYVVIGPVKSLSRAAVKVAQELDGDAGLLKDVVRASVAVQNPESAVLAVENLKKIGTIVQVRDRMSKPLETGYRDMNIHVRLKESKVIAEVQVLLKPMLKVKNETGHRIYEELRVTPTTSTKYQTLLNQSRRLYDSAWLAAGGMAIVERLGT